MRIAVGGFHIESCSFSPLRATEADFQVLRGDELLSFYPFRVKYDDVELIPIVRARSIPSGRVDAAFYRKIKDEFLAGLRNESPWDGVFLHLHGAVMVEGMDDAEGDFIAAVRGVVGDDCLISASYDLHGNVSERVMDSLDFLTAYRTAPHVDCEETDERAFANLARCVRDGLRPKKAFVRIPVLLTGERTSTEWEPGGELYRMIPNVIGDGVLDASILVGYAWADEPRVSASVVAFGTDETDVRNAAQTLAGRFWEFRRQFDFGAPVGDVDECARMAMASDVHPVVISDSGDNITAGAPGDMTLVLQRLLELGARDAVVAGIPDAAAVERCQRAGVGAEVELALGGKLDPVNGSPLDIRGRVVAVEVPVWSFDVGTASIVNKTAVVQVDGVTVIVTSRRSPYFKVSEFQRVGVDPTKARIVVVKMGYLSPEICRMAARSILALSPGAVNQRLESLPFKRLRRPIFPLDPDMTWSPSLP